MSERRKEVLCSHLAANPGYLPTSKNLLNLKNCRVHAFKPSVQALGQPGGAEAQPMSVEALRALLPACAARGIPMLVANPDVVTVDAEMLVPMPGMLAQVSLLLQSVSPLMRHPAVPAPSSCRLWWRYSFCLVLAQVSLLLQSVSPLMRHPAVPAPSSCRFWWRYSFCLVLAQVSLLLQSVSPLMRHPAVPTPSSCHL